ncbi:type II toxin-antitoxin system VapC family toxin [Methylocapsa palsarum]|uniref:Ribonuclease VapC n=1 Tax=Methylocapsa palsarum TaxID=1612308 RepID=A0A1I3XY45_9HYPH|nr:type II toxin-antitoxin system VapC family toxin [Methylocapsa palsarum]SFK24488.1 tRNA(fMet)-specific endonuclease VapC [Methylocapsa palsarum]
MFCLDTNAVIAALNEKSPLMAARLDAEIARGAQILLSAIVLYELRYGVAKSVRPERSQAILAAFLDLPLTIAAFDSEDAKGAGEIRAALAKAGTPIGPYDVLIAAQARRRSATLVTANRREFERVPGLVITDWMAG